MVYKDLTLLGLKTIFRGILSSISYKACGSPLSSKNKNLNNGELEKLKFFGLV